MAPLLAPILLSACAAALGGQREDRPPPDLGAITLPLADPTIPATVTGVPATLRVALDARDTVELAPPLAARADVKWEGGDTEEIGRVRLPTRLAAGLVTIGGVSQPLPLTTHDRPCCGGHDGEIGPLLLPWSIVRFVPPSAPGAGPLPPEQRFPAAFTARSGLYVPDQTARGMVRLMLAPDAAETIATASAGAILAELYGGHFVGSGHELPIAFGVSREVRDMVFDRPFTLLGLPVRRIAVRLADYGGGRDLPQQVQGGEIIVKRRGLPPQHDWPAVAIGRDLLGRCPALAVYRGAPNEGPSVGLSCTAG